uniref:Uncharacterized protein n=1 Tax=Aegilops tauschii TaxID=37682 RepID=R7W5D1_AEGTA
MSSDFDEDQNVPYAHPPDGPPLLDRADNVRFRWHASDRAPLHENRQQVLLEVHDASSAAASDRLGLDLVAVLDVSKSMRKKDRLGKMKTAMHFVINKLGPKDRLSIVKFSEEAERLCPLLSVTPANKPHLMAIVDGLQVIDPTNIRDGLETALGVLGRRRISGGRLASIFLLSDGDENIGHATNVDVSDVPVYTFGFGTDFDPKLKVPYRVRRHVQMCFADEKCACFKDSVRDALTHMVLDEIARRSKGGTFNFVDDGENMTEPFSQILGGLLSVVVQDLKLIVSPQPGDSILEDVDSRLYQQTRDDNSGAVIVHFGDLFAGEIRRVIAHIRLPAVGQKKNATAITAQCSYRLRDREEGRTRTRMERPVAVEARNNRPWKTWWGDDDKHRWSSARSTSACAWVLCILCVLLVIGAIVLGILLFAVYNHKMPYLAVADAQLGALQADASFSRVNLALKLQGVDMLLFRAPPFVVPPDSSMPLQYNDVVSTGRRLDKAGMRSMDKSLNAGVVPFDLHGKVRTRGNTGIFQNTQFWTRFSCRLRFFFPGNGTVIPADRRSCRSSKSIYSRTPQIDPLNAGPLTGQERGKKLTQADPSKPPLSPRLSGIPHIAPDVGGQYVECPGSGHASAT